jgi:hypothetical protein
VGLSLSVEGGLDLASRCCDLFSHLARQVDVAIVVGVAGFDQAIELTVEVEQYEGCLKVTAGGFLGSGTVHVLAWAQRTPASSSMVGLGSVVEVS